MGVGTDTYTYETRSITPQECTLEKTPTIKIAYQDITMQDMFERPEYVSRLKQTQEIIDNVQSQITELHRKRLIPTAVLINHVTLRWLRGSAPEIYIPAYKRSHTEHVCDLFMGLEVGVVDDNNSNKAYIRVVV